MKKYTLYTSLLFLLITISCNNKTNNVPINEHKIQSMLWQQNAAEYRALCYQAFNFAKLRLDNILKNQNADKPLAIIADIDETVLDNSPYDVKLIESDTRYEKSSWIKWGKLEIAKPVPGVLEFLSYANKKGIEIFYISNRYNEQLLETKNNLQKLGFPNADDNHILLRKEVSSKKSRRAMVSNSHKIIMLLGDNLTDFSEIYDNKKTKERNHLTDSLKHHFGNNFILLPNPIYGDWESKGIYEGKSWNIIQEDSIRRSKIISY